MFLVLLGSVLHCIVAFSVSHTVLLAQEVYKKLGGDIGGTTDHRAMSCCVTLSSAVKARGRRREFGAMSSEVTALCGGALLFWENS